SGFGFAKNSIEQPCASSHRNGGEDGKHDDVLTFPDRREDRLSIVVNQAEDPVIELIVVLGEITDVGDENNRAQSQDDAAGQAAYSLMPNAEWINESNQRESE